MTYDLTKDPIYYDSFGGLVKCCIRRIIDNRNVEIEITARNNNIHFHHEILTVSINWLVPRAAVHTRFGQLRIRPFKWQPFNQ